MGLHGFFQYLADMDILGRRMSPDATKDLAVDLDLFGCYYFLIKYWLVEEDMKNLKTTRQQQQQQQQARPRLFINEQDPLKLTRQPPSGSSHPPVVYALHRGLSKRFSQSLTQVHAGDVFSTTQRCVGQEDRLKQKETNMQNLATAVNALPRQGHRKFEGVRGRASFHENVVEFLYQKARFVNPFFHFFYWLNRPQNFD